MHSTSVRAFRVAAVFGFLAVGLGAFGAHGLESLFAAMPKSRVWWEKAVFYHAIHAAVMLVAACQRPVPVVASALFGAGICLFSGSLYFAAVGGPYWLVYVTPLGGLCLLAGWLWLAVRPPAGLSTQEGVRR